MVRVRGKDNNGGDFGGRVMREDMGFKLSFSFYDVWWNFCNGFVVFYGNS